MEKHTLKELPMFLNEVEIIYAREVIALRVDIPLYRKKEE